MDICLTLMQLLIMILLVEVTVNGFTNITNKEKRYDKKLRVLHKYAFLIQSKDNRISVNAVVNHYLQLSCEILPVKEKPKIIWNKDGEPLIKKNFRFYYHSNLSSTYILHFENVMLADAGDYECLVGEGDSKISKVYHVVIKELTHHQKLHAKLLVPPNLTIKIKEDLSLTCKGEGENGLPKFFQWDRLQRVEKVEDTSLRQIWTSSNGERYIVKTMKTDQCSDSSVLQIHSATYKDDGIYVCAVFNRNGYATAKTELTVALTTETPSEDDQPTAVEELTTVIIPILCVIVLIVGVIIATYVRRTFKMREMREINESKLSCLEDPTRSSHTITTNLNMGID